MPGDELESETMANLVALFAKDKDLATTLRVERIMKNRLRNSTSSEGEETSSVPPRPPLWLSDAALFSDLTAAFSAHAGVEALRSFVAGEVRYAAEHAPEQCVLGSQGYLPLLCQLLADESIGVAASATAALPPILPHLVGEPTPTASDEDRSLWSQRLSEVLMADTNSATPYRCLTRIADCWNTKPFPAPAVKDFITLCPGPFNSFFHAACIAVSEDVLQFLNFLTVVEKAVICGLEIPAQLWSQIATQLQIPMEEDVFASLSRPQLLYFAGHIAQHRGELLSDRNNSTTVSSSSSETSAIPATTSVTNDSSWVGFDHVAAITAALANVNPDTGATDDWVPAALEAFGALLSTPQGVVSFLAEVDENDDANENKESEAGSAKKVPTSRQRLGATALAALHRLCGSKNDTVRCAGYSALTIAVGGHHHNSSGGSGADGDDDDVTLKALRLVKNQVFPKSLFKEVLWPSRSAVAVEVRAALWKLLAAVVACGGGATLSVAVVPMAGTFLTGGSTYESEHLCRAEQLRFIRAALDSAFLRNNGNNSSLEVLQGNLRVEYDKGLYPVPGGVATDVAVGR